MRRQSLQTKIERSKFWADCLKHLTATGSILLIAASTLLAQPKLKITSPADGAVVNPGQSLTVTVAASPAKAFRQVLIIGQQPMGFSQSLSGPPYEFTIQIPKRIDPGKYLLTADGFTAPGQETSDSITVMVVPNDSPVSLQVYPSFLRLSGGEKGYLRVTGVFSDGTNGDLTKSTRIVYVSDRPNVAAVQAEGIVTAVAPGSAKVNVTYGKVKAEVPVTVEGTHQP